MVKIKYFFNEELKLEIVVPQKIARMIVKKWYELSGKKARYFSYDFEVVNFNKTDFSSIQIMKYDCKGKTVTGANYENKRMYLFCKTADNNTLSEGEDLNKMQNICVSLSAVKGSMLNFA